MILTNCLRNLSQVSLEVLSDAVDVLNTTAANIDSAIIQISGRTAHIVSKVVGCRNSDVVLIQSIAELFVEVYYLQRIVSLNSLNIKTNQNSGILIVGDIVPSQIVVRCLITGILAVVSNGNTLRRFAFPNSFFIIVPSEVGNSDVVTSFGTGHITGFGSDLVNFIAIFQTRENHST